MFLIVLILGNLEVAFIIPYLSIIMANFPSLQVPAYEFHFNLAVYPLPDIAGKTVNNT
jgi:hypothetical protein